MTKSGDSGAAYQQLTLFAVEEIEDTPCFPIYDPAWDKCDDQEPPDPDDYPTIGEYETAWNEWEKRYPELVAQAQGMTVLEQETTDTQQGLNPDYHVLEQATNETSQVAPEQSHWTEEYKVSRYNQEHKYYRYIWMEGRKLHHRHIPGGNVRSQLAQRRKQAIDEAINFGRSPSEIEKMIHSWR